MRVPLIVGGCAYHLSVRTEHVGSLVAFATQVAYDDAAVILDESAGHVTGLARKRPSYEIVKVDYQHTSNLPQGRCDWLRRAVLFTMDRGRALALSVDSDTSFTAGDLVLDMERCLAPDVAIACAPVRIGGTQLCNLNVTREHETRGRMIDRASMDELARVLEGDRNIESGGFGLVVFNLSWFRVNWPEPTPEGIEYTVGEDIAMCRAVRARGGRVIALRVRTQHNEFRP